MGLFCIAWSWRSMTTSLFDPKCLLVDMMEHTMGPKECLAVFSMSSAFLVTYAVEYCFDIWSAFHHSPDGTCCRIREPFRRSLRRVTIQLGISRCSLLRLHSKCCSPFCYVRIQFLLHISFFITLLLRHHIPIYIGTHTPMAAENHPS